MNLVELHALLRRELDDVEPDYLWSDEELTHYLDEAQREYARETLQLADARTPAIAEVFVAADEPFVEIDPRVLKIRRAQLASETRPLQVLNFNEMDQALYRSDYGVMSATDWTNETGIPRILVLDMEAGHGRLIPIPLEDDQLYLSVYRLPLEPLDLDANSGLEITDLSQQRVMLHYAKALAYDKHDADTEDPEKALQYRALFAAEVQKAKSRLDHTRRRPGTVRYGGL